MHGTEIFTKEKIDNVQTITTLEIAEMMNIEHYKVLRKLEGREENGKHIKGYIEILNDNQMGVVDYFIKSSYMDAKGEERPCYDVECGFDHEWSKDDYIPETLFYRLGMKAGNAKADKFQNWLAMEVIPSVRNLTDAISAYCRYAVKHSIPHPQSKNHFGKYGMEVQK